MGANDGSQLCLSISQLVRQTEALSSPERFEKFHSSVFGVLIDRETMGRPAEAKSLTRNSRGNLSDLRLTDCAMHPAYRREWDEHIWDRIPPVVRHHATPRRSSYARVSVANVIYIQSVK